MNIKIIGSNCSNGIKLKKNLLKIINEVDGVVEVELRDDVNDLKKYNVKNVPGLIINGEKYSEGKVPGARELLKMVKSYA